MKMNEKLLQYLWQERCFDHNSLRTSDGQQLELISQGKLNTHQGPDFLEARIRLGNTVWAGNIELHVKASDWDKHQHSHDSHYNNVILHVVWEEDKSLNLSFPTLELNNRIPKHQLKRYQIISSASKFIPCENLWNENSPKVLKAWKPQLILNRLQRKAGKVLEWYEKSNHDWQETFWWLMARQFGMKQNADAFQAVAFSVPLKLLLRQQYALQQSKALLLGQAGLLKADDQDPETTFLYRNYSYLSKIHRLQVPLMRMDLLRMRPANFPQRRLKQLAHLAGILPEILNLLLDAKQPNQVFDFLMENFKEAAGDPSEKEALQLGSQLQDHLLINVFVPFLFAYGGYKKLPHFQQKALLWLESTKPEINAITKKFTELGFENLDASVSQSLLELKSEFCNKRLCLECKLFPLLWNQPSQM